MLRGKIFYDRIDVNRNKAYIDWLIAEAAEQGLVLELAILGQDKLEPCDFVINRSRNYELALKYELNGIRVFNNSKFTLVGNNKLAAYGFIHELGIDHARIYLDETLEQLSSKVICKPNTGHGGQGISLIDGNSIHSAVNSEYSIDAEVTHINSDSFMYQEYIENNLGDVRYYVINNQIIHSILRTPQKGQVVSNFSKGGNISVYKPSNREMEIVDTILTNIHMDFGGIDFIIGSDGKSLFNEFEDVVGSRMLSALGVNDTTNLYIKHIKDSLLN